MYKFTGKNKLQDAFIDFDQPLGFQMNPNNRWVKLASLIPWDEFEVKYSKLFPSKTGNVAKPLRMALGALIIQSRMHFTDRELVEQITENPYLQYFIGLSGYQPTAPFDSTTLVNFRKRITVEMLMEINEYIISHNDENNNDKDDNNSKGGGGNTEAMPNKLGDSSHQGPEASTANSDKQDIPNGGTMILDATCAPVYIRYPLDVSLLNEGKEIMDAIIYRFCKSYGLPLPRRRRKQARRDYLNFAKAKKPGAKKIRSTIRKLLGHVARDIRYLEQFMGDGYAMLADEIKIYLTIMKMYKQQKYMYDNRTHTVDDRIVSLKQPWIRPIVRGKINKPVEFGAKLDLSLDTNGYGRIEKISFDAYNESTVLIEAVERFKERNGYYPERVLADQIYRTRDNRKYCKDHGIRLSGPKLGRPSKDEKVNKKQEYQDNTDRIEVERAFSLGKRCYGMGRIVTKLEQTQLTSIALSVFVMNLFKIHHEYILDFLYYKNFRYIFDCG